MNGGSDAFGVRRAGRDGKVRTHLHCQVSRGKWRPISQTLFGSLFWGQASIYNTTRVATNEVVVLVYFGRGLMFRSDVWGDSDYSWRQVSLRTRYLLAMGAFHDDLQVTFYKVPPDRIFIPASSFAFCNAPGTCLTRFCCWTRSGALGLFWLWQSVDLVAGVL